MDLKLQLEMPLEALLLRHPASAAGSLWTWLAVLAAAFGLWRIRSVAVAPRSDHPCRGKGHAVPDDHATVKCDVRTRTLLQSPAEAGAPHTPSAEVRSPPHVAASDEVPCLSFTRKGTLFEARGSYVDDEDRGGGGDGSEETEEKQTQWATVDGGGDVTSGGGGGVCWGERWRGDLGWYVYQDVAALNGRVVRLWEDEKRLQAAARLTRRRMQLRC